MAIKITHNGTVQSDELNSPGYICLDPATYGLDANHADGWHCAYRPLSQQSKNYIDDEAVRAVIIEHINADDPPAVKPIGQKIPRDQAEKSIAFSDWMTARQDNDED